MSVGHTPQQNGVAERNNRIIVEMAKSMIHAKGMPQSFWGEAVYTAVYLLNRCPTKAVENKTPFEAWSRRKPSVNHLKVFGCICFAHVPKEVRHKLDEASEKCIFVGYSSKSKGYKLFSLKRNKVIVCRDVIFDEKAFWDWKEKKIENQVVTLQEGLENRENECSHEAPQVGSPNASPQISPTPPSNLSSSSSSLPPRRMRHINEVYASCNFCMVEPRNFEEAIKEEAWIKASEEEIDVIEKNNT